MKLVTTRPNVARPNDGTSVFAMIKIALKSFTHNLYLRVGNSSGILSLQINIKCSTAHQNLWETSISPLKAGNECRSQIQISDFRNEWLLSMLYSSNSSLTARLQALKAKRDVDEHNRNRLYQFKVRNYTSFMIPYYVTEAKSIHSKRISTASLTNFTVVVKVFTLSSTPLSRNLQSTAVWTFSLHGNT
jgi:hypothetical protein